MVHWVQLMGLLGQGQEHHLVTEITNFTDHQTYFFFHTNII